MERKWAEEILREPDGHAEVLTERFLKDGGESLSDQEMIELVLLPVLGRFNVIPVANRLLTGFGSFAEVISADPRALIEVKGVGKYAITALKAVQGAALRLVRQKILSRPVMSSQDNLLDYCRASMSYRKIEQFRILFLDRKNVLIADEVQQTGTVDHAPVYPREVMKRALDLGASAIILVHNHPSGDPTPSSDDIEITREVREAGEKLGIALHDHLIIGRRGHASFKSLDLL